MQDDDLLEIKEIFQELSDEWNIYWIDEIDSSELLLISDMIDVGAMGLGAMEDFDENTFVYSIKRISDSDHKFLVHLILPKNRENLVWKNFDKFISDIENIEQRIRNIGYKNVTHHHFNDGEGDKGRHFQVFI
jgi:hypothetical protein